MGGVREGFDYCPACKRWVQKGVPQSLLEAVVPATIATDPGRWYSRLATYKVSSPAYRGHIAAVAWSFIEQHETRLAALAGGDLDIVTPVPSKRGCPFAEQPLQQALRAVKPVASRLAETLRFEPAEGIHVRNDYYPDCFDAGPVRVRGSRVLLVEDSWVTGATALSAGGALLKYGAEAVVVLSIARVLNVDYWRGHPYLQRVARDSEEREPFDITLWRR
jgi:hypothetical protein